MIVQGLCDEELDVHEIQINGFPCEPLTKGSVQRLRDAGQVPTSMVKKGWVKVSIGLAKRDFRHPQVIGAEGNQVFLRRMAAG